MKRLIYTAIGLAVWVVVVLLLVTTVARPQDKAPAVASATKQPAAETKPASNGAKPVLPDTVLADEKLSLEWLNLRLNARLARETVARMRSEADAIERQAPDIEKAAEKKLEEIRVKAAVPPDYIGELRGNQVVFTRPVSPAIQTAGTTSATPPKKESKP